MNISNLTIFDSYEEYLVYGALERNPKNADAKFESKHMLKDVSYVPDLYAPNGIPSLNIEGETLIEVKSTLSYSSMQNIRAAYSRVKDKFNFVVIYFQLRLSSVPKDIDDTGRIYFLSYEKLKGKRKDKEGAKGAYYLKTSQKVDWKKYRDNLITEAKTIVEKGNCALFLGAGVSMSAKMPSWNDLLKGLMSEVKQLKGDTLEAFKELSTHVFDECGDSYLVMARYLQSAIRMHDKNMVFSDLIRNHLYSKVHTSSLLKDLASIVQLRKTDEIITYNFDDILEQELINRGLQEGNDFLAISKDAEISGHSKIPIYHVHGIIPEKGPADIVVFSEEEYHKRYSNPLHWSNIEQLHALSRKHCFFIGLSMTDPNLRRLLDAARNINKTDGENHYAFLRRQKLEKYCLANVAEACKYMHVSESLIDKNKQKDIYTLNYSVLESIFRELGVKVIWYEEFDELPELIEKVFGLNIGKTSDAKLLIQQAERKIGEIQSIEDGLKGFSNSDQPSENVIKYIQYIHDNSEKYRNLISDVGDMLTELSNRVKSDSETLLKMLNNRPKYNNNMSGYAEFYSVWLSFIKKVID